MCCPVPALSKLLPPWGLHPAPPRQGACVSTRAPERPGSTNGVVGLDKVDSSSDSWYSNSCSSCKCPQGTIQKENIS